MSASHHYPQDRVSVVLVPRARWPGEQWGVREPMRDETPLSHEEAVQAFRDGVARPTTWREHLCS